MQALRDKKNNYYGSQRMFYSGCPVGSTTAWNWVGFSGAGTGFGADGNTEANRIMIIGSNTSVVQFSFDAGTTIHGELGGNANDKLEFHGVNYSGLHVRASAASQKVRIWAW